MPTPSLQRSWDQFDQDMVKISTVLQNTKSLDVTIQHLLAEIMLIRSTSLFEYYLAEIAYKVACGASYLDGSAPKLLHRAKSMSAARQVMLTLGRIKPKVNLSWTRAKFIKDSVSPAIDRSDNYVAVCDRFGSEIAEIFSVRNYAAHRSTTSRSDFKAVVRRVYGRNRNISLGTFLISPQIVATPNLQRYIGEIRVIIKEIVRKP